MARYAYDVNTTQRYIDVHKQFQGGLKTVDTDDSLGAVYLRDAENISLSEFGFIEKRYGTYENFKLALNANEGKLQGYWEFLDKWIIIAFDGNIYWQSKSTPEASLQTFSDWFVPNGTRTPKEDGVSIFVKQFGLVQNGDYTYINGPATFQKEKEMGAVIQKNVIYIFTGTYPIFIAEEDGALKPYFFGVYAPDNTEIAIVGHNFLENDFEDLYYNIFLKTMRNTSVRSVGVNGVATYPDLERPTKDLITVDNYDFSPKRPYAVDGKIDFVFGYKYADVLAKNFQIKDASTQWLNLIETDSVEFRNSSPGANDLAFSPLAEGTYTKESFANVNEDVVLNVFDPNGFNTFLVNSEVDTDGIGSKETYDVPLIQLRMTHTFLVDGRRVNLFYDKTDNNIFTLGTQPIKHTALLLKEHIEDNAGGSIGFVLSTSGGADIDIETRNQEIKSYVNNLRFSKADGDFSYRAFVENDGQSFVYSVEAVRTSNSVEYPILIYSKAVEIPDTVQLGTQGAYVFRNPKISVANVNGYLRVTGTYERHLAYSGGSQFDRTYTAFSNELIEVRSKTTSLFPRPLKFEELSSLFFENEYVVEPFGEFNKAATTQIILKPITEAGTVSPETSWTYFNIDGDNLTFEPLSKQYRIQLPDSFPSTGYTGYYLEFNSNILSIDSNLTVFSKDFFTQVTDDYYTTYTDLAEWARTENYYNDFPKLKLLFNADIDNFSTNGTLLHTVGPISNAFNSLNFDKVIGRDSIALQINKGLNAGTYDFKFNFIVKRKFFDSNGSQLIDISEHPYSFVVPNVSITQEIYQDYPGLDTVPSLKLNPLLSCTNVIEHFGKLMVWGSEEMPNALFYSFPDNPLYFPTYFYLDFTNSDNDPLLSVTPYMNILVAQTEDSTWGIRGNSGLLTAPSPYTPFVINPNLGTIAPKSVRVVRNHLFFLSKQGISALKSLYAADEQYNIDLVDRNIFNIVPQDKEAVGIQYDNQYWLNFPNFGITLRWYIDKKAWVLDRFGSYTNQDGTYVSKAGPWYEFNGVFKWIFKDGLLQFITKPSRFISQENLSVLKVGVDYSLPTDLGGNVLSRIETSFLNQNYPFHPKNYKEAKMDFTVQNEYNKNVGKVYSMNTNEDIFLNDTLHEITQELGLIPNHRYEMQYYYDYNSDVIDGGIEFNSYEDVIDGGNDWAEQTDIIDAFYFVIIDSVSVNGINLEFEVVDENTVRFVLPNNIGDGLPFRLIGHFENYELGADLTNVTYDEDFSFKTWVIGEDKTLNIDNRVDSYEESLVEESISKGTKMGDWTFGVSDFGNKVTAVKTLKLAGKSYNAKLYLEDNSRTKWTLESLGLTYKMKRARSR